MTAIGRSRIAVAICAWNGEAFLADAIRSVLAQTRPPDEVVLFDDGSSDRTVEIAQQFPGVRVIEGQHRGLAPARNRVVPELHADLITFLDVDDLLPPGSLASREQALAEEGSIDAVFGACVQFDHSTGAREPAGPARLPGTLLARRSVFERAGPFDESLRVGEFIDWWTRAEDLGIRYLNIPEVALLRRNHAANMTRQARDDGANQDYLRVIRERMRRRQATQ